MAVITPESELDFDHTVVSDGPLDLGAKMTGRNAGSFSAWQGIVTFVGQGDAIVEVTAGDDSPDGYRTGQKIRFVWGEP